MTKEEITDGLREYIIDFGNALSLDDAHSAMDEYAKQQAIAFFKFCLPGPTDFEPHISKRYDQFIEQQNKS